MAYSTTTTGHRQTVSKTKDSRVLQILRISSSSAVLRQSTVVTTDEYFGLSLTDAETVCVSSESSTLGTTTRQYLGAVKITLSSGGSSQWTTIESCWGTKVSSRMERMGDTNLYHVTVTTEAMTVTNNGGTIEMI